MKKLSYIFIPIPLLCSTAALAENDIKDMSDPLAVYIQVGTGIADKGINFKNGQAYDTGEENVAGMNVFEVKGIAGETLGWYDADHRLEFNYQILSLPLGHQNKSYEITYS